MLPVKMQMRAADDDIVEAIASEAIVLSHGYERPPSEEYPSGGFKSMLTSLVDITSEDVPGIEVTVPPSSYGDMSTPVSYDITYGRAVQVEPMKPVLKALDPCC